MQQTCQHYCWTFFQKGFFVIMYLFFTCILYYYVIMQYLYVPVSLAMIKIQIDFVMYNSIHFIKCFFSNLIVKLLEIILIYVIRNKSSGFIYIEFDQLRQ